MRDLRAELQELGDSVPIEWNPVEGDILVGFVRDASSIDTISVGSNTVVVEEERSGTPVLVSLDSPQLAALFELHSPRSNDRIGIKCTGHDSSGVRRFVMMIDREGSLQSRPGRPQPQRVSSSASEASGGCSTATPEEREHIERMLAKTSAQDPKDSSDASEGRLKGVIRRQEEELARQTRALERLEALISQSLLRAPNSTDFPFINARSQSPSVPAADANLEARAARRKKRLRALLIGLAVLTVCVLGTGFAFLKLTLH